MTDSATRYALFFAPRASSPWASILSRWLGYDAATGRPVEPLSVPHPDRESMQRVTEHPRRYGAHATLKAPFRLATPFSEMDLVNAVAAYAAARSPFPLPALRVELLSDFIALTPLHPDTRINRIANACTTQFDRFRAPLNEAEMERRLRTPLDPASLLLLKKWGYPHVLEKYRFHISLTGTLGGESAQVIQDIQHAAHNIFDELAGQPLDFDAVCIFKQSAATENFILTHRLPFTS